MWPDRVSNSGPLTYESGALPTALRGPAAKSIMKRMLLNRVYNSSSSDTHGYTIPLPTYLIIVLATLGYRGWQFIRKTETPNIHLTF